MTRQEQLECTIESFCSFHQQNLLNNAYHNNDNCHLVYPVSLSVYLPACLPVSLPAP